MAQGITIKGKTPSGQNVEVQVDSNGVVQVAVVSGGGGGGGAAKPTDAYAFQAKAVTASYTYFYFEDASLNWYIMRKDANGVFTYTKGTGGYTSVYTNSTSAPSGSPTFDTYGVTF